MNKKFLSFVLMTILFVAVFTSCTNNDDAISGVLTAPLNFTAVAGDEQVTLNWSLPTGCSDLDITKYEVSKDDGKTWETASSVTSHTFTGLINDTEYTFKVRACNANGAGDEATVKATPKSGNGGNGKGSVKLLETVSVNGALSMKYEYDEQNRISNYVSVDLNTINSFTYNVEGDLITVRMGAVSDPSNYFEENFIKREDNIVYVGYEMQKFELNPQGFLCRNVIPNPTSLGNLIYVYEYMDGNLSRMESGWTSDIPKISIYTYDDQKSPFYNCNTPQWYMVWGFRFVFDGFADLQNNRLTKTSSLSAPWLELEDEVITYTYTYDEAGYPLTCKDDSGQLTTYTYIER